MISIEIPGWGNLEVENAVFDWNGTLAEDGELISGVREKIESLAEKVKIYILTADTHGTVETRIQGLKVELVRVPAEESRKGKLAFLQTLKPETVVSVGNGSNDSFILKESALGIAVLGKEGLSLAALKDADLVVKDVSDAMDLLLKPKRLTAILRE
jgi:soluble P-type ATPase